jgi:nucleotide-binding universal stress UspA family protein
MPLTFRKILVPTDFSKTAEVALGYAVELSRQYNAELHLLHVGENPMLLAGWASLAGGSVVDVNEEAAALRDQLRRLVKPEDRRTLKTEVHVLIGQPTGAAISRYALDGDFELIVMGTHGRGAITHALLGSVAESVVRSAPCPVLTIRHPGRPKDVTDRLREAPAPAAS